MRPFLPFLGVALSMTLCMTHAEETQAGQPASWPKYNVRRFLEDYSQLSARTTTERDFFDRLKHIDLTEDGQVWLTLGGQLRGRMEGFSNFAFGAPARDDDGFYFLHRYRFHGGLHATEHFRLFAEGKVALSEDRDLVGGRRTLDVDTIALQNAFAEITLPIGSEITAQFRAGRQELLLGKQRLVSPLDWANTRRTFDALRGSVSADDLEVTGFFAKPVVVDRYDFNSWNPDVDFWGIHASAKQPLRLPTNVDLYFFGKHTERVAMPDIDRFTLGTRVHGALGDTPIRYDVETAAQFGEVGSQDIGAWFLASHLSTTFADLPWQPWLAVGFDASSGDDSPTDGEVNTFDQLFPLGHAYHGYIDIVGRQNVIDLSHSAKVSPTDKLWLKADGHVFWRTQTLDALYNAGGGVVRRGAPGTSAFVGYELDLTFKYTVNHHFDVFGGYSHFFAGDFLDDTGASDDIDFWYLQTQFTF